MTRDELVERLERDYTPAILDDILLADGLEDALIGIASQFNTVFAVYDSAKCIQILIERDGMSYEEASEFLEFNTLGAWVGKHTPAFMVPTEGQE